MLMSTVATKERDSRSPKRRAKVGKADRSGGRRRPTRPPAIAGSARAGTGSRPRSTPSLPFPCWRSHADACWPPRTAPRRPATSSRTRSSPTPGSAIRVMRAANNGGGPHGRTRGVREAVDVLTADRLRRIAEQVDTYDPFERPGSLSEQHERFRRHAVATRYAADRIAELARLTGSRRAGRRRPASRRRHGWCWPSFTARSTDIE